MTDQSVEPITETEADRLLREFQSLGIAVHEDRVREINGDFHEIDAWVTSATESLTSTGRIPEIPTCVEKIADFDAEWKSPADYAKLLRENRQFKEKLEALNARRQDELEAEAEVRACREEILRIKREQQGLKDELKDAEASLYSAVNRLQSIVRRQGGRQRNLAFSGYMGDDDTKQDEEESAVASDDWGNEPLSALVEFGMTDDKINKILEAQPDINTVRALRDFINADDQWHRKIKGLGETWIDKLTDALTAYYTAHPEQSADSESEPAHGEEVTWEAALGRIKLLQSNCEEIPDAGADFANSVVEESAQIAAWIEEHEHVTPDQIRAIQNWEGAVSRWVDGD